MLWKYKLYKYKSYDKACEHRDDIITKQELYFSSVEKFNDPIDSNLAYRKNYSKEEIKEYCKHKNPNFDLEKCPNGVDICEVFVEKKNEYNEKFRKRIGILCLSSNPKNILMWSHYADNHKGLLYEFEFEIDAEPEKNETNENNLFLHTADGFYNVPFKVEYRCDREYELFSYTATGDELNQQFGKMLTTKAPEWIFEQEYRFIDLKENGSRKFNKKCLKSIIFGVSASDETIQRVKRLCKENDFKDIKFKKAKFIDGKFELEFVDL